MKIVLASLHKRDTFKSMSNTNTIEEKNNEARQFAIAQIQAVMDAEKAKRAANAKAHLEAEMAKWVLL